MATGGFYDIDDGMTIVRCTMRGRLKKERRRTDLCVIGDRARFDPDHRVLEEVLPRTSVFSRRHPGRGGRYKEDVLVANLRTLQIVVAFGDPPMRPRLVDRFLCVAESNGLDACIVANKVDERRGDEGEETARILETYRRLGYTVTEVSAIHDRGLDPLRATIDDGISAFVGPSGVGKSSLLNALDPALSLRVAAISDSHGKGRHTTRVATLHPIGSGYLADTPGIREMGVWDLDLLTLDESFVEFRPFLSWCSFGDCSHLHEPGCGVREAVARGEISQARFESYAKLMKDDD